MAPDVETEALVERVREPLNWTWEEWARGRADNEARIAALADRVKEVERERDYFRDRLPDFSAAQQADFARAERAEAERDVAIQDFAIQANAIRDLEATVLRLREALEAICEGRIPSTYGARLHAVKAFARAALTEEGE